MAFVLDASITACWAFADESHPWADQAMDRLRRDEAMAPALWWFEVRNILVMNERRGRLSQAGTASFLRDLAHLGIVLDRLPAEAEVLRLARAHRLSVYDAAYLELAQRCGVPLATLDGDMIRAARAEAVSLVGENA